MGFVTARTEAGREQLVPEHFFDNPILCRGLTRVDEEPVDEPAPTTEEPNLSWTVAQLKDYAGKNALDLGGATVKADILASIQEARQAAQPDNPAVNAIGVANPVPDPQPDPTETPATGENQE